VSRQALSTRLRAWLAERAPIPMAAPELPALRQARLRIIAALGLLALAGAGWEPLGLRRQPAALAALAGLATFLALQIPLWALAKLRADEAWLMRKRANEETRDA
jgi:hypothetical protein